MISSTNIVEKFKMALAENPTKYPNRVTWVTDNWVGLCCGVGEFITIDKSEAGQYDKWAYYSGVGSDGHIHPQYIYVNKTELQ